MLKSLENRSAVSSLIFARIIYAVNWLNLGAVFVLMEPDLGVNIGALGNLTSAFYVGIGLMQVPGGLMAAKWGAKRVVVAGIFLSSISALLTAASSEILEIEILRFFVGMGMAFVFAPAVMLVAKLFGGKPGVGIGLFNSAYDFGGILALFGWIVIAEATGWRASLAFGGALGILTGVLVQLFVPSDSNESFRPSRKDIFGTIGDRHLVLLGLGTLGFGIGNTVISGFMVVYLAKSLGVDPVVAGGVASLIVLVPVVVATWGGAIYDRSRKPRTRMATALIGSAAALVLAAFPSIYTAAAAAILGGIVSGIGYTFAFAWARDLNRLPREYDTLAISWVNSISLIGSFIPPVFFSYLVVSSGYYDAWLGCAALTMVFLVPLILMSEKKSP